METDADNDDNNDDGKDDHNKEDYHDKTTNIKMTQFTL